MAWRVKPVFDGDQSLGVSKRVTVAQDRLSVRQFARGAVLDNSASRCKKATRSHAGRSLGRQERSVRSRCNAVSPVLGTGAERSVSRWLTGVAIMSDG